MTRIRPLVLLAVVALLLGVLAGCGSSDDGPLVNLTAGGVPRFAVAWDAASVGQSGDFAAYVVNQANDPVTLVSASLIPIPGRRTDGRLRGDSMCRVHWRRQTPRRADGSASDSC